MEKLNQKYQKLKNGNIGAYLPYFAEIKPFQKAVVLPHGRDEQGRVSYVHLTFQQLNERSNCFAHSMIAQGLKSGNRAIILLPQDLEFITLIFAMLKIGVVPVLIEANMSPRLIYKCLEEIEPEVIFYSEKVNVNKSAIAKLLKNTKQKIIIKDYSCFTSNFNKKSSENYTSNIQIDFQGSDQPAIILFTSGDFEPPKGVVYTHGMLQSQMETLGQYYQIDERDISMITFPLFAVYNIAFGITSILPDMNFCQPQTIEARKIIETINDHGVTITFGSPIIWEKVTVYCKIKKIILPSITRILIVGAPVSDKVLEAFADILTNGTTYVTYGAIESIPLTSITGIETYKTTAALTKKGKGICVGTIIPGVDLEIISVTDEVIKTNYTGLGDYLTPKGEIGEIIVKGKFITTEYCKKMDETAKAKIKDKENVWHRLGDLGYFDDKGRLWYVGRKNHRVVRGSEILYPICIEGIFNETTNIRRSALVGIPCLKYGHRAILVVEPDKNENDSGSMDFEVWKNSLFELAKNENITIDDFLFIRSLPVDKRHNLKILRESVADWAWKKLKNKKWNQ